VIILEILLSIFYGKILLQSNLGQPDKSEGEGHRGEHAGSRADGGGRQAAGGGGGAGGGGDAEHAAKDIAQV
jgi:hypothetical protein